MAVGCPKPGLPKPPPAAACPNAVGATPPKGELAAAGAPKGEAVVPNGELGAAAAPKRDVAGAEAAAPKPPPAESHPPAAGDAGDAAPGLAAAPTSGETTGL